MIAQIRNSRFITVASRLLIPLSYARSQMPPSRMCEAKMMCKNIIEVTEGHLRSFFEWFEV